MLSRFASILLVLLALVPVAWFAAGRHALGLDFQGGLRVVFKPVDGNRDAGLEQLRLGLDQIGADASVFLDGDNIVVEVGGLDEEQAAAIRGLASPIDLRLLPVPTSGWGEGRLGPSDRASLDATIAALGPPPAGTRVVLGPASSSAGSGPLWEAVLVTDNAVVTGRDVADAGLQLDPGFGETSIWVELSDDGARRFHDYTRGHVGERLAIVIDGELASAPVIQEPISGGRLRVTTGWSSDAAEQRAEARRLAARLQAGRGVALVILEETMVGSAFSTWFGRPLALALAVLALLSCILAAIRRRVPSVACAAGLLAGTLGLAAPGWIGGTLTATAYVGMVLGALPAVLVVGLARRRGGPSPSIVARLVAGWPGWALAGLGFVAAFAGLTLGHGYARGVSFSALATLALAVPVALLALVALRPGASRPEPL